MQIQNFFKGYAAPSRLRPVENEPKWSNQMNLKCRQLCTTPEVSGRSLQEKLEPTGTENKTDRNWQIVS